MPVEKSIKLMFGAFLFKFFKNIQYEIAVLPQHKKQ